MQSQFREFSDYKVLGRRELPNLSLQKTAYLQGAQSYTHNHENARFVYVLRGRFSETYERRKRECIPFMTVFRPPLEKHSEDFYGNGIICLSVDIKPIWLAQLNQYNVRLNHSADFRSFELVALIRRLSHEFDNKDNLSLLAIEALMLEIAVEISRPESECFSKDRSQWLSKARDYIHAEFTSNLSVAEVAAAAHIHPVHLARVFRRSYGCTIAEYIRRLRVDLACTLLVSSADSLAQIAIDAGFSDQSHFCKVFRRMMNCTPSEYRSELYSR